MIKEVKIGDIVEIVYGSGTTTMIVDQVYSDDDIRGHSRAGDPLFTVLSEITQYHGNIADPEDEDI